MDGIVLRYGAFYGPDNPSTRVRLEQLLRRRAPVVWHDRSLLSFIHQDDAVSATIAALERGEAGAVYNVADDEPVSASEFTRRLAAAAGAPPPFGVPLWLLKATMPYLADVLTMRLPLSNRRAQAALGWRPQFSTTREGLEDVVRRLGARRRAA
jgi:nucleoside-diphosphate-sugar epimerase